MGLLRGGSLFFVGALLLISLIVGNVFLTAGLSLNQEDVQQKIVDLVENSESNNLGSYFLDDSSNFFMRNFYYSLILSLILLTLVLFLSDPKSSFFTLAGILILISSLPVLLIGKIFSRFEEFPLSLISLLFTRSFTVFLATFVIGIILIALGFAFKFWSFGYSFYESSKGEKVQEKIVEKVVYTKKPSKKGKRS